MRRFLFLLLLGTAASTQGAWAQKIIEKSVVVASGQRLYLNLRHAQNIRIRPGASGRVVLKATVDINQNKLNDALQLTQETSGGEVIFKSDLDTEMLQNAQPGNCPNGGAYYGKTYIGHGKNGGVRDKDGRSPNQVCVSVSFDIVVPADVTLRVSTISGDIDIVGLTGAIDAKSISGFVDVTWGAKSADLSLKTITGEVYTDQDVAFSNRKDNPVVGYQVRGTLGSNGPLVKLESISNDVYFRKRK